MRFFPNLTNRYNRDSNLKTLGVIIFFLPLLLFLPVLYYSLSTPFALVDDYGMCYFVEFLDNSKRFWKWLQTSVLEFGYGRYRPFFDFYNMTTWKIFGAIPWLHHLARWLMHFSAIGFFSASFVIIARDKTKKDFWTWGETQTRSLLIPLGLLVYIWIYFPNVPAARLGPQEINTVFFLGLCNLMLAFILIGGTKEQKPASTLMLYLFLYLGYLGLSVSKEINIAVMLWIGIYYFGMIITRWSWKRILGGLPLILIFTYTLEKILIASRNNYYGVKPVTPELVASNLRWIASDLFQPGVSLVITCGFIILIAFLFFHEINKLIKHQTDNELIFIILLVGELVSLYLIVSTSWAKVLRYWYVILPVFTTILAFSARSALELTRRNFPVLNRLAALTLISFVTFFIGCNYYNFLWQSVAQHSLRKAESELLNEISRLHDQGQYVYISFDRNDPDAELLHHLIAYYRRFSPRFLDKKYKVHTSPPETTEQPYYMVSRRTQPGDPDIHKHIVAQQDYISLNYAKMISGLFQQKSPRIGKDAGVHLLDRYEWIIYNNRS